MNISINITTASPLSSRHINSMQYNIYYVAGILPFFVKIIYFLTLFPKMSGSRSDEERKRENVAERTAEHWGGGAVRNVEVNLIYDRIATIVTLTRGDSSSSPAGSTMPGSDVGAIAPGDRLHRVPCERRPWRETASPCSAYVRRPSRTWCPTASPCLSDTGTRRLDDATFRRRSNGQIVPSPPRTCVAYLSGVVDRCDSRHNV